MLIIEYSALYIWALPRTISPAQALFYYIGIINSDAWNVRFLNLFIYKIKILLHNYYSSLSSLHPLSCYAHYSFSDSWTIFLWWLLLHWAGGEMMGMCACAHTGLGRGRERKVERRGEKGKREIQSASPFSVTCMCDFRADYLVLDKQLGNSSTG